jgi:hypothetical protein
MSEAQSAVLTLWGSDDFVNRCQSSQGLDCQPIALERGGHRAPSSEVQMMLNRRAVTLGLTSVAFAADVGAGHASGPAVLVSKDPNCDCCGGWVEHLRTAGYTVTVRDVTDLAPVKARLGVPTDLAACHTAEVAGYVIEGHVPAEAVRRLLREKPSAKGLAVAGMPVGSPGMEVPGSAPEEYAVVLFGQQRRIFARFRGSTELGR